MNAASTSAVHVLRPQILERRARLQAASRSVSAAYLTDLIAEVDAALERIEDGSFGLCETCHDPIEPERLQHNPMTRFCLDHLSQAELKAHEQDIELAMQIQAKLLPPRDIALEHWETHYRYLPAGAVGGDYCELIPGERGDSLFFAVGDVAGKGVAASLLMTHLSAIFRSLLSLDLPLIEVMSRANRLFCDGTASAHYATLVCGRARGDELEICNAGHCAPLLVRKDATQRLDSSGLPLGLFCGVEYAVTSLRLAAGDSVVLYSDGVTEAQDANGNDYGEERLISTTRSYRGQAAHVIAEGVLREVNEFRGGRPASDDVTLLILRRR